MQLHLYQRVIRFVGQLLAHMWLIVIIIIIRHEVGLDRPLSAYMVDKWRILHVKLSTTAQTDTGEAVVAAR